VEEGMGAVEEGLDVEDDEAYQAENQADDDEGEAHTRRRIRVCPAIVVSRTSGSK
jgi:hypothetical protein